MNNLLQQILNQLVDMTNLLHAQVVSQLRAIASHLHSDAQRRSGRDEAGRGSGSGNGGGGGGNGGGGSGKGGSGGWGNDDDDDWGGAMAWRRQTIGVLITVLGRCKRAAHVSEHRRVRPQASHAWRYSQAGGCTRPPYSQHPFLN